jgi:pantothenate synthetase
MSWMWPLMVHSVYRLTDLHLFGPSQIVDIETLQEVETIRAPVVFAVAARFGSVRLLDNIELEPS